ncbi:hypothetical protein M2138_001788 [Dysgonomonadaceae bacterium PH5-43]|nr:hypothetical protein [Dysgonomonadaceae bacterium PH5-43]
MRYLIGLLTLFFCFQMHVHAQKKSDSHRPPWIYGDMPAQTNYSYWFKQMYGEGGNLSEARQNATLTLLGDLIKSKGFTVSGNELEEILSIDSNNMYNETVLRNYSYNIEYAQQKISFQPVDEYWELRNGNYICYVLYEVANNPENVDFEPIVYTTNYGASALLRSAIIPGWGQMHKRQTTKGIVILSSEVLGVAGVIYSQNMYKSYRNKAKIETNNELRNSYKNKSNNWGNIRNGFIIGASAIYIYNIIDVVASKGAKRYNAEQNFMVLPFLDSEGFTGVSLSYTF